MLLWSQALEGKRMYSKVCSEPCSKCVKARQGLFDSQQIEVGVLEVLKKISLTFKAFGTSKENQMCAWLLLV